MKKIILLLVTIIFWVNGFSQAPNWLWAKRMGGTSGDMGHSIALDGLGNILSAGTFSTTADFDPGPGIYNLTSAGISDVFISKLDSSGNFVWAKAFGGAGIENNPVIVPDAAGNIYIAGWFQGTIDFDPGPGIFNLTSAGFDDIFILKLDASGNFVWALQMGSIDYDVAYSITLDASANIYTIGYFGSTVDFDPGVGVYNLTATGNNDIFISRLDSSGNFIWARRMGGSGGDFGTSIALDVSGNILSSGFFNGVSDFDPGPGTFNLASSGSNDIFVSKLDSSGNFTWARAMGGAQYDQGSSITTDAIGNIFTTGFFSATGDFDAGPGIFTLTSAGLHDIFISKLDASGNFVWAKAFGSTVNDEAQSIVADVWGNVFFTGAFGGMIDFDPGSGIFYLTSGGSLDIFLCKLDGSGNFIWAKRAGSYYSDYSNSLVLDSYGAAYTTGLFNSPSISFDLATLTNTDTSGNQNSSDIFIAKLDSSGGIPTENRENIFNSGIHFSPNPATSELRIENADLPAGQAGLKIKEIEIYSSLGEKVFSKRETSNPKLVTVNVSQLFSGIYFVRVKTEKGISTAKFVKE
jgi:hypothetical protein